MPQTGQEIEDYIRAASGGAVEAVMLPSPKAYIAQLKDIYYNRWRYLILNTLKAQFDPAAYSKIKQTATKEINLLKSVIDKVALVYKAKPIRSVDEARQETYEKYANENKLNLSLKTLNKLTELCGNALLHVGFDPIKGLEYTPITFDNAEIFVSPSNPFGIVAIRYYSGLDLTDYTTDASLETSDPFVYSSAGSSQYDHYVYSHTYIRLDNGRCLYHKEEYTSGGGAGKIVQEDELPILPFVLFGADYPEGSLLNFARSSDLRDATVNTAVLVAYHNNLLKYQAHKQAVIITDERTATALPNPLTVGANSMLVIPDGGGSTSVDYQASEASYDKYADTIIKRVNLVLANYGIKGVLEKAQGGAISGYAIMMSMIDIIEKREDDVDLYRLYEHEIFDIQKKLVEEYTTESLGEEFAVEFKPLEFPKSPQEISTEMGTNITHKVKTPVDYIISTGQAETREDALIIYKRNTDEIAQARPQPAPLIAPTAEEA